MYAPVPKVPAVIKDAGIAPEDKVPIVVKDDVTTFEARVVPVSVPAGAMTTLPEAEVINPLPFTVNVGMEVEEPKLPTLELTVARVPTAVTFPDPSKEGEVYVKSPDIDIVRAVARMVAVSALPVRDPTKEPEVRALVVELYVNSASSVSNPAVPANVNLVAVSEEFVMAPPESVV